MVMYLNPFHGLVQCRVIPEEETLKRIRKPLLADTMFPDFGKGQDAHSPS